MNLIQFPFEILYEIVLYLPHCCDVANLRLSHSRFADIPQCQGICEYSETQRIFLSIIYNTKSVFGYGKTTPTRPPTNHQMNGYHFTPFEKRSQKCVAVYDNQDLLIGVLNRLTDVNHKFGLIVNCPENMKSIFHNRCPSGCFIEKDELSEYSKRHHKALNVMGHMWTLYSARSFLIIMNPGEINFSLISHYGHDFVDVIIYCSISNGVPYWFNYYVDVHFFKHNVSSLENETESIIKYFSRTGSFVLAMQLYLKTKDNDDAIMISSCWPRKISLDMKSVLPLSNHVLWHFFHNNLNNEK